MADKWGKAVFSDLIGLRDRIEKLSDKQIDSLCQACAKELAKRLLSIAIKRTPVKSGSLRRGWVARANNSESRYADSLKVTRQGTDYVIEVLNPLEYSSYVEFGHRTRGGKGWVKGRYMLTISEEQLKTISPKLLEKLCEKKIKEALNGES